MRRRVILCPTWIQVVRHSANGWIKCREMRKLSGSEEVIQRGNLNSWVSKCKRDNSLRSSQVIECTCSLCLSNTQWQRHNIGHFQRYIFRLPLLNTFFGLCYKITCFPRNKILVSWLVFEKANENEWNGIKEKSRILLSGISLHSYLLGTDRYINASWSE